MKPTAIDFHGATSGRPGKYVVARAEEIPEGHRAIVRVEGRSYGVFNIDGTFYALLNRCPHQGGELCKGPLHTLVEGDGHGRIRFDTSRWHISCPWHGWEFDVATGRSYFDPQRTKARRVQVSVERGDEVAHEVASGTADVSSPEHDPIVPGGAHGTVVSRWAEGPYQAETVEVSVEDDYVMLVLRR